MRSVCAVTKGGTVLNYFNLRGKVAYFSEQNSRFLLKALVQSYSITCKCVAPENIPTPSANKGFFGLNLHPSGTPSLGYSGYGYFLEPHNMWLGILKCNQNIYTHLTENHWWGAQKTKFLKESMKLNWNFQRGGASNSNSSNSSF